MTLDQLPPGTPFTILAIPDPAMRVQALRVGFGEGASAVLQASLPGGPVILRRGAREFAIGRAVARAIAVRPAPRGGTGHGRRLP